MVTKPLHKRIYHYTVKNVLNIITLRKLRKIASLKIRMLVYKQKIKELEKDFPDNTVLIFQQSFFNMLGTQCYNGGAERYVVDLADILTQFGYKPVLVQLGDKESGTWKQSAGKLDVIGLSVDLKEYASVIQLFTKFRFVIYSGAVIDWGKKLLHPNILISHGITWDAYSEDGCPQKILDVFKEVDKFVSVDTNTISWLRSTFPKTLKNLDANYIPNYVDTEKYYPVKHNNKDKEIYITFPRRANMERGYWLMSEALPSIFEKYDNVFVKFVGFAHGDDVQQDMLHLEQKYPGHVTHCMVNADEMPEIYQNTDISVIPTVCAEGTSLSCLEAQACGNVVIATNIGGLPNLILNGYNGILINPNVQELINALDMVLSDEDLRKNLSKNAVAVSYSFDKKVWQKRWSGIIEQYRR